MSNKNGEKSLDFKVDSWESLDDNQEKDATTKEGAVWGVVFSLPNSL